jgi:hypothetical protein
MPKRIRVWQMLILRLAATVTGPRGILFRKAENSRTRPCRLTQSSRGAFLLGLCPAVLWLGRAYEQEEMYSEAITEFEQDGTALKDWPVIIEPAGHAYGR